MTRMFNTLAQALKPRFCGLLLVALFCLPAVATEAASDDDSIGHVQIVLGKAYIESVEKGRQRIEAGSKIYVGDEITTRSNGTVFINFVDDASVSVRQDSHLQILSYQYDKARPEDSKVKFNLVRGVTRAISGEAATAAREQFRLNTPIAAIGVRGTDFVVRATDSTTEAQVNEGTIVLAPLSAECSTDSFGPCVANAVELTGDSFNTIALDNNEASPRVLPAAQDRGSEVLQQEVQTMLASNTSAVEEPAAEPYVEEVFVEEANSNQVAADTTVAALDTTATIPEPEPEIPEPEIPEPEIPIPDPVLPDFTPALATTEVALKENQLVWGRFAGVADDLERITLPRADAAVGREVTLGNFEYTLYRDPGDRVRVDRSLGTVNFALDSAQAFHNSAAGTVALRVVDGTLGIDFQENTFATQLNLDHETTGPIDFSTVGGVFDGGFLRSSDESLSFGGSGSFGGAVSFDGQEAGYFFEQQLENASIEGLTLWNAR
ncbi:MAG: FecR domain-containing protein [Pseudohongiellaceae bacterium]